MATTTHHQPSSSEYKLVVSGSGLEFFSDVKSGISPGAAGATLNELWIDTSDGNTLKIGV